MNILENATPYFFAFLSSIHLFYPYFEAHNRDFYQKLITIMALINGLHFNNIRGDIYGGLTAAVVALPLAIAMGVASGVGAIAGLYGGYE